MPKDAKGLAILIAGKPAKDVPPEDVDDEYDGEEAPPDEEYTESEYPEFDIPAGLDLSDMVPGDEKQVLSVVRKKSDGTACIVSVDGIDLSEEAPVEEEAPSEAPPGESMPPPPVGGGAAIRTRAVGAGLM